MEFLIDTNDARELTPLINFTDSNYLPTPYVPPGAVSATHGQPRFGHTNSFDALLNGSEEQQKDYVMGIILGAMIILIVALVWFLGIVCLKIAGQKRVGFLAGHLVRPAAIGKSQDDEDEKGGVEVVMEGDDNDEQAPRDGDGINEAVPIVNGAPTKSSSSSSTANDDIAKAETKFTRQIWFVRSMFVLSGIIVIISGGLFYGKGVVSFRNSIDEVRQGIDLVQTAAYKTIELTDGLLLAERDLDDEMEPSREVAAEREDGSICGLDSELSVSIRNVYDELSTNVDEFKGMLEGSLASFGDDLRSLVSLTEEIDSSLDQADIFFYILIAISVIIIGLIAAMLVGVFFAWKGINNCFTIAIRYAIIWPLFIFVLILSWIFATLFLVASLAGADFCISPDQYVQSLLNRNADEFDGIIFGFVLYYISGCTITPAGDADMVAIMQQARLVTTHAHDLLQLMNDLPIERIGIICGLTIPQAQALKSLVDLGHDTTHVINRGAVGLRDVLACETFNPIYTTFVHEAFCVEGVSGLKYIFSTTLFISIFSMVMIMFRAALYPIKESAAKPASGSDEGAMEVVKYNENKAAKGEENATDDKPAVVY